MVRMKLAVLGAVVTMAAAGVAGAQSTTPTTASPATKRKRAIYATTRRTVVSTSAR